MSASSRPTRAPCTAQRERQIRGHRGLADAALAGGDRDDVADRTVSGCRLRCTAAQGSSLDTRMSNSPHGNTGRMPAERLTQLRRIVCRRKSQRDCHLGTISPRHAPSGPRGRAQGLLQPRDHGTSRCTRAAPCRVQQSWCARSARKGAALYPNGRALIVRSIDARSHRQGAVRRMESVAVEVEKGPVA